MWKGLRSRHRCPTEANNTLAPFPERARLKKFLLLRRRRQSSCGVDLCLHRADIGIRDKAIERDIVPALGLSDKCGWIYISLNRTDIGIAHFSISR